MEFRLATADDILKVRQNPLHTEHKEPPDMGEIFHIFALDDDNGELIGVGGFQLITNTTAWVWVELSKNVNDNLIVTYRVLRDWIEQYCRNNGIIRLQCFIDESFPQSIRLAEHLGFDHESRHLMHRFFNDRSAWLYYRIME